MTLLVRSEPRYATFGSEGSRIMSDSPEFMLEGVRLQQTGDPDALRDCSNSVRHAIAMHYVYRELAKSPLPLVRCFVRSVALAQTHGGYSSLRSVTPGEHAGRTNTITEPFMERRVGEGGGPIMQTRIMHYLGSIADKMSVPKFPSPDSDNGMDDLWAHGLPESEMPKALLVVNEYTYDQWSNYGMWVRCKKSTLTAFLSAVEPLLQPYFMIDDDQDYPMPGIMVQKPRSKQYRQVIPVTLLHHMESLAAVLPESARRAWLTVRHGEAKAEIERFQNNREEIALKVLAARGNLAAVLQEYDWKAKQMYLKHNIVPHSHTLTTPPVGLIVWPKVDVPGLNGSMLSDLPAGVKF